MSKLKSMGAVAQYYFDNNYTKDNKSRQARWKNHLAPFLDKLGADTINISDMQHMIRKLKENNLSDQYIDNLVVMVKSIINKALAENQIDTMPFNFKEIKATYKSNESNRIFTNEELRELIKLAAAKDPQLELIIKGLYLTAARPGALLDLKAIDIDFLANDITFKSMKKEPSYNQPMHPKTKELMQQHIQAHNIKPDEYLFTIKPTARSYPMDYKALESRCRALFKSFNKDIPTGARYNKKRVSLYTLRHTQITNLVKDLNPIIVQKYVNHSSIEMTMRYTHISKEAVQEGIDKTQNII